MALIWMAVAVLGMLVVRGGTKQPSPHPHPGRCAAVVYASERRLRQRHPAA